MYSSIFRNLIVPAYEGAVRGRSIFPYWRRLERTQWADPARLQGIQTAALRALLLHAQGRCDYYRQAWQRAGLEPARLRSLDDFHDWPVVTRETIAANRRTMRATGVRLISKSTGGSSGVPLRFDIDHDSADRRFAAAYRGYSWAGAGPGTKQAYLWGVPLARQSRFGRLKENLYQRLHRRMVLNSFELSEQRADDFLRRINRYEPDVIVAYTGAIDAFARFLEEARTPAFKPRAIVVGAEKLHQFQRERIERVFGAPVFETYGSREFMLIGAECERHEGLHLTAEHLLVEVLDDDGNPTPAGEEGNVVITDLYNYGMPFIRYMNGDRAIAGWSTCSCGRGLPLLRKVVGRRLDVLTTPDGRRLPGEFFPHLMKDFAGIRRFQVVQERLDAIQVRLEVGHQWGDDDERLLARSVQEHIGPFVRIELSKVQSIGLTRAGKHQVVVNRLQANCN